MPIDYEVKNGMMVFFNGIYAIMKIYSQYITELNLIDIPPDTTILDLERCAALTTLPDALPNNLTKLNLRGCKSLTKLPDNLTSLINLTVLNLRGCTALTTLPGTLPNSLTGLNLEGCNALTTLPGTLPNSLTGLNLEGCTALTTLPDTLPNNLTKLDLRGCTSLPNTPALIAQLEELEKAMQDRRPDSRLLWPDHLNRKPQITQVKQNIIKAYKIFYKDSPEFTNKEPNITDKANYPVLSLMHRFMSESLAMRGGVDKIVKSILPIAERILHNPSILEYLNPIAQEYLDACVNQPVAGFALIANLVGIDKQDSMTEKLEQSKSLFLLNKINKESVKLAEEVRIGPEVEVEFANAMLKKVNEKLIANNDITKPILGAPDCIAYEGTVVNHLTDANIEEIHNAAKSALSNHTKADISNIMTEGAYQMFWASQSLEADRMQQYKEDIKKLQTDCQDALENGSMTQNDFETQQREITSALLQESKRKTEEALRSLDGRPHPVEPEPDQAPSTLIPNQANALPRGFENNMSGIIAEILPSSSITPTLNSSSLTAITQGFRSCFGCFGR